MAAENAKTRAAFPENGTEKKTAENAFGLYVHWPFCVAKCPYCDFNSHVAENIDFEQWRRGYEAALAHFAEREDLPRQIQIGSIFFGGGTPSLMPPELVERIIDTAARYWPLAEDVEITLEANPNSSDTKRFSAYALAGVNRLSLGVQALDDAALKQLGRVHTVKEARQAWTCARKTFARASFDLIYARPYQTASAWERELKEALLWAPDHLSAYQLTMEPETPFYRLHQKGRLSLPDEETALKMFEITKEHLAAAGLLRYEVSNHARPGAECRHNLLYWRHGAYLGIGPGAHGRLHRRDGTIVATQAWRSPAQWLKTAAQGGLMAKEPLHPHEAAMECLLMGLRTAEGLDLSRLARRAGLKSAQMLPASFHAAARGLAEAGLAVLNSEEERLRLTDQGLVLLETVTEVLLPEEWLSRPGDETG